MKCALGNHDRMAFLLKNSVNGLLNSLINLPLRLLGNVWWTTVSNGAIDEGHGKQ